MYEDASAKVQHQRVKKEKALAVFAVSKAPVFATVCHPLPACKQGSCDAARP